MRIAMAAILAATAACAGEPPGLAGTGWRIVTLGGSAAVPPSEGPSLAFDAEGTGFRASAGCNTMTGAVEIDGDAIRFGRIAMTRMACPGPLMQAETALAEAFQAAAGWRIEAGRLVLSDAGGGVLASFAGLPP